MSFQTSLSNHALTNIFNRKKLFTLSLASSCYCLIGQQQDQKYYASPKQLTFLFYFFISIQFCLKLKY